MAQPRHKAIIAGLAVTLTLGTVAAPAVATSESGPATTDSDPNGVGAPRPANYDKADFYEGAEGVSTFAQARSASSLSPVALTSEMKYFTKYESGCNYNQQLSPGDGYNAMGYYQFDRRYALVPFLQQVYSFNPGKYAMFEPILAQADTLRTAESLYDAGTGQLTVLAQQLNAAWGAAYAADPAEFSALQDSYSYNNYYLPVQSMLLNNFGVDIRNRPDCIKGLAWGMCNLFGQGGVQKFLRDANLSNEMTDRQMAEALCDSVINGVAGYYPGQPQYHNGWQNRYRKEKQTCLDYIAQHEAEQEANKPVVPAPRPDEGPGEPIVPEPQPAPDAGNRPDAGNPPAADPQPGPQPAPDADVTPESNPQPQPAPRPEESPKPQGQGDAPSTPAPQPAPQPELEGDDPVAPEVDGDPSNEDAQQVPPVDTQQDDSPADGAETGNEESGNEKNPEGETGPEQKKENPVDSKDANTTPSAKTSKEGLPQTGDIAALVMTGAAGMAVAGGSFVSLGKKERERTGE